MAMLSGVAGFMYIEEYPLLDAFYMTVITISTVGFTEVRALSPEGRLFTSLLIMVNIVIFTYAITNLSTFIFDGEARRLLKHFRMNKEIDHLTGHTIVCGYGRIGRQVCEELKLENQPFIVIEREEETINQLSDNPEVLFIKGNAINDAALQQTRILHARALITTLPSDADNVFVTLSAREINPNLLIISRTTSEGAQSKLERAGADYVIMPERLGGSHMASIVTKPDVLEFLRKITAPGTTDLFFEEISFNVECEGKTIREMNIRAETGVNIIGFKLNNGEFMINPSPDTKLKFNTKLIVLGNKEQIDKLQEFIKSQPEFVKKG